MITLNPFDFSFIKPFIDLCETELSDDILKRFYDFILLIISFLVTPKH
jgi:hypothetical protein